MKNLILAIESSCDDSSIAIIDKDSFECVFHKKISQELAHSEFGGVVPELAARLHTTALPSILEQCSGYFDKLCAVAVTSEPGLSVSLLGGITMAKVLCASLRLPLIPVNHLVGHIYSLFLTQNAHFEMGVLLVSGGHTMLINVDKKGFLEVLASTNDDSFGESFDKVAKMLALARPNGVCVQECAQIASEKSLNFPVPLKHSKELAFSFSGLKNAVRLEILRQESLNSTLSLDENSAKSLNLSENSSSNKEQKSEIAFAFEEAATAHLIDKCRKAFAAHHFSTLGVVGGASANLRLRGKLQSLCAEFNCELRLAPLEFCADNALMIARAACALYERGEFASIKDNIISPKNKHFTRL
mgnify:CR=1 FL=1